MLSLSEHSENPKAGEERGHAGIQLQKQISLSRPFGAGTQIQDTREAFGLHPWLKANNLLKRK